MISIRNDELSVVIAERGAELWSVRCGGKEYLWQGDPRFWTGRAPILFPICGAVKDNWYLLDGVRYDIPKHGFAKEMDFEVDYHDKSSAVMLLRDTEETRKMFPFAFELRVSFMLRGRRVKICYDLLNTSEKTIYFSMGAHEAYALPGGLSRYKLVFPQEESFETRTFRDGMMTEERRTVAPKGQVLSLHEGLFSGGTLAFDRLGSKECVLCRDDNARAIRVSWEDYKKLLIWTMPGADYVCLEPWAGSPDPTDSDHNFAEKPDIISAWPGETVSRVHSFEIIK